jgi:RNA polymerase sigma factor (sigma-70 family)
MDKRILIDAMLRAGVMEKRLFRRSSQGTPQGGILSPLLANIYLHELDCWWWESYGRLTLYEACLSFPLLSEISFERYARRAIRFGMIDLMRAELSNARTTVTFVDPQELREPEVAAPGPVESAIANEQRDAVRCWVKSLGHRERELIEGIYWLRLSQTIVARMLAVTPPRVSQIHRSVLRAGHRALHSAQN